MKTINKLLLAPLLAASLFLFSGCKDEKQDEKKILVMATSADYPPFEFYKNEEVVGFDIDLARMITKELGYELKILDMDFVGIIPALQSGKIDFAISAINPTLKRAQNVDFSQIYYHNDATFLYIKDGINDDLLNFKDKIFSAQIGSVFEDFLYEKQKEFPSIKIHSVAKIPLLIEDLKLGRVDAILLDKQIAHDIVSKIKDGKLLDVSGFNFGAAIAFPKSNNRLVEKFNTVIDELQHNGEIAALNDKWFKSLEVIMEAESATSDE